MGLSYEVLQNAWTKFMEIIGSQAKVEDSRLVKQDYSYVALLLFHPLPSVEPGLKKERLIGKT